MRGSGSEKDILRLQGQMTRLVEVMLIDESNCRNDESSGNQAQE